MRIESLTRCKASALNGHESSLSPAAAVEEGIPWDRRGELGTVSALIQTVKLFAVSPTDTFGRLGPSYGFSGPLLFGVLVGLVAILLNILGAALFGSIAILDPPPQVKEVFELTVAGRSLEWIPLLFALVTGSVFGMLVSLVVFPPIFVLGLYLWSAVLHGSLRIVGGTATSGAGFRGTFSVAAYSSLAFLVHLVPLIGDLVATLWVIVLQTIGLAAVHRTSRVRALLAIVLLPLVLAILLAIAGPLTRILPGP